MGSVGARLNELKQRVANLPLLNKSKTEVQNVLIQDKRRINEILDVVEKLESKGKLPEPEVKVVHLDRIYTRQAGLDKQLLNDYVDKPIHELATGYMYEGDVLVNDGNHRLALAKLNNQGTVRMKVIDLEKKKKLKIFGKRT